MHAEFILKHTVPYNTNVVLNAMVRQTNEVGSSSSSVIMSRGQHLSNSQSAHPTAGMKIPTQQIVVKIKQHNVSWWMSQQQYWYLRGNLETYGPFEDIHHKD